eukprot:jgi/Mesvir1/21739/Mv04149-RA.1
MSQPAVAAEKRGGHGFAEFPVCLGEDLVWRDVQAPNVAGTSSPGNLINPSSWASSVSYTVGDAECENNRSLTWRVRATHPRILELREVSLFTPLQGDAVRLAFPAPLHPHAVSGHVGGSPLARTLDLLVLATSGVAYRLHLAMPPSPLHPATGYAAGTSSAGAANSVSILAQLSPSTFFTRDLREDLANRGPSGPDNLDRADNPTGAVTSIIAAGAKTLCLGLSNGAVLRAPITTPSGPPGTKAAPSRTAPSQEVHPFDGSFTPYPQHLDVHEFRRPIALTSLWQGLKNLGVPSGGSKAPAAVVGMAVIPPPATSVDPSSSFSSSSAASSLVVFDSYQDVEGPGCPLGPLAVLHEDLQVAIWDVAKGGLLGSFKLATPALSQALTKAPGFSATLWGSNGAGKEGVSARRMQALPPGCLAGLGVPSGADSVSPMGWLDLLVVLEPKASSEAGQRLGAPPQTLAFYSLPSTPGTTSSANEVLPRGSLAVSPSTTAPPHAQGAAAQSAPAAAQWLGENRAQVSNTDSSLAVHLADVIVSGGRLWGLFQGPLSAASAGTQPSHDSHSSRPRPLRVVSSSLEQVLAGAGEVSSNAATGAGVTATLWPTPANSRECYLLADRIADALPFTKSITAGPQHGPAVPSHGPPGPHGQAMGEGILATGLPLDELDDRDEEFLGTLARDPSKWDFSKWFLSRLLSPSTLSCDALAASVAAADPGWAMAAVEWMPHRRQLSGEELRHLAGDKLRGLGAPGIRTELLSLHERKVTRGAEHHVASLRFWLRFSRNYAREWAAAYAPGSLLELGGGHVGMMLAAPGATSTFRPLSPLESLHLGQDTSSLHGLRMPVDAHAHLETALALAALMRQQLGPLSAALLPDLILDAGTMAEDAAAGLVPDDRAQCPMSDVLRTYLGALGLGAAGDALGAGAGGPAGASGAGHVLKARGRVANASTDAQRRLRSDRRRQHRLFCCRLHRALEGVLGDAGAEAALVAALESYVGAMERAWAGQPISGQDADVDMDTDADVEGEENGSVSREGSSARGVNAATRAGVRVAGGPVGLVGANSGLAAATRQLLSHLADAALSLARDVLLVLELLRTRLASQAPGSLAARARQLFLRALLTRWVAVTHTGAASPSSSYAAGLLGSEDALLGGQLSSLHLNGQINGLAKPTRPPAGFATVLSLLQSSKDNAKDSDGDDGDVPAAPPAINAIKTLRVRRSPPADGKASAATSGTSARDGVFVSDASHQGVDSLWAYMAQEALRSCPWWDADGPQALAGLVDVGCLLYSDADGGTLKVFLGLLSQIRGAETSGGATFLKGLCYLKLFLQAQREAKSGRPHAGTHHADLGAILQASMSCFVRAVLAVDAKDATLLKLVCRFWESMGGEGSKLGTTKKSTTPMMAPPVTPDKISCPGERRICYFRLVAALFDRCNVSLGAAKFAMLALHAHAGIRHQATLFDPDRATQGWGQEWGRPEEGDRDREDQVGAALWESVVHHALGGRAPLFHLAYCGVLANPYSRKDRGLDGWQQLVRIMCERGATKALVEFPFAGMLDEIEAILYRRAQLADVSPSARPNLYKLLYSWHMQRCNHRRAALYQLRLAQRLALREPGPPPSSHPPGVRPNRGPGTLFPTQQPPLPLEEDTLDEDADRWPVSASIISKPSQRSGALGVAYPGARGGAVPRQGGAKDQDQGLAVVVGGARGGGSQGDAVLGGGGGGSQGGRGMDRSTGARDGVDGPPLGAGGTRFGDRDGADDDGSGDDGGARAGPGSLERGSGRALFARAGTGDAAGSNKRARIDADLRPRAAGPSSGAGGADSGPDGGIGGRGAGAGDDDVDSDVSTSGRGHPGGGQAPAAAGAGGSSGGNNGGRDEGVFGGEGGTAVCLTLEDLQKQLLMCQARAQLWVAGNPGAGAASSTPLEMLRYLLASGLFETALTLATSFFHGCQLTRALEQVFEAMARRCCALQLQDDALASGTGPSSASLALVASAAAFAGVSGASGTLMLSPADALWPGLERAFLDANMSGLGDEGQAAPILVYGSAGRGHALTAWSLLRSYLERFDGLEHNFRLRVVVAETILTVEPRMRLPRWLVAFFQGGATIPSRSSQGAGGRGQGPLSDGMAPRDRASEPVALFRVYMRFGKLADAADLALDYLDGWSAQDVRRRQRHCATWFPYPLLAELGSLLASACNAAAAAAPGGASGAAAAGNAPRAAQGGGEDLQERRQGDALMLQDKLGRLRQALEEHYQKVLEDSKNDKLHNPSRAG